jgi:hypothetical protein
VREQTHNPAASIRDGCFGQCASSSADVLPALLAGKNVLDGSGADVDLVLVGCKFQPGGQQAECALGVGLDVFEADDALDVLYRGALRSLRSGKLPTEW